MLLVIKILVLSAVKKIVELTKSIVDRFLIRDVITGGKEMPMLKWFTWTFIRSLTLNQILGLLAIAGFTLLTFPLGVWVGSFTMEMTLPINQMVGHVVAMCLHPINFLLINKTLTEFRINRTTLLGLAVVELGLLVGLVGWYLIYQGNKI